MELETKKEGRGIVLIAVGHYKYGCMAAMLAASIRFVDKDIPIHLVHSEDSISWIHGKYRDLFTSFSLCPKEYYHRGETFSGVKAKTYIWELSPFEYTLFLDADMIWLSSRDGSKAPSKIFEQLKDVDFTIQNRGFEDLSKEKVNEGYSFWCNIQHVKDKYKTLGRYYDYHSEFIYFNRCAANKKYFAKVRQIFDKPKIPHTNFGGDMPDEFAFDIASAILAHYPHKDNYIPIYWSHAEKKMSMNEIVEKWYGYSMGGSGSSQLATRNYDMIAKFACRHLGLPAHFPYTNKAKYLPERRKI